MSKAIEFLKLMGVPDDVVTSIESADDQTDLSGFVESTETHFTNYYKERVKDEIHKAGKGSAYAEAKNFVKKQFGLTEAEIKELDFQGVLKFGRGITERGLQGYHQVEIQVVTTLTTQRVLVEAMDLSRFTTQQMQKLSLLGIIKAVQFQTSDLGTIQTANLTGLLMQASPSCSAPGNLQFS